ncbi:MAG: ABC transporter ATP-binding protein [Betaproteobacteria bacterium]|nr:ABC transporter ATP-binding protein [Betaproteobacteria bacterium]
MSAAFEVEDLSLRLGGIALAGIGLRIERGECLVILGPNGAGKSVLLESIAGFRRIETGQVVLGGRDITALAPERRRIAFMFQDFALFPHLSVVENVCFGAGTAGEARVERLLGRFGIAALRDRLPYHLSGGEKQRVALARALATEPALLLLDEPSSALDARARDQLHDDLRDLLAETGVPMIYVTHDRVEALTLADRIAVMRGGRLVQQGRPEDVIHKPSSAFVADFVGMETMLRGRISSREGELALVACGPLALRAPAGRASPGEEVFACARPENVRLLPPVAASAGANRFAAHVEALLDHGPYVRVRLRAGEQAVVAFVPKHDPALGALGAGSLAQVAIAPEHVHLVAAS